QQQQQQQQNYTRSSAAREHSASGTARVKPEKKENLPGAGEVERLPGHVVEEDEAKLRSATRIVPGRSAVTAAKPAHKADGSGKVAPDAVAEGDKNRGFAEAEHIKGHTEQAGEEKLRLAGEAEPDISVEPAGLEAEAQKPRPIFLTADQLQGHVEEEIEAIGRAELSTGDQFISAQRMKYNQATNDAKAEGSVRIEQGGDILEGSNLKLNVVSKIGQLSEPSYQLKDASSRGHANTLLFEGDNQYRLQKTTYTTCPAGDDDWLLQVADLKLDNERKVGTAKGVKITFKDMPILYTPWMNFSYSGERKSGLLAPTYGLSGRTGLELALPFYWNIAPNYDATISARAMSRRGVALNSEFRYLGNNSSG
ncbi:MAG TPA: putative LPS assembly protein LptD, partial [Anseongella sp.]|nr:putative LPS assembly protein LptD [Anseongella sp.]